MEQRFNKIIFKLKLLNYSISELMELNILQAHEQILYYDFEKMFNRKVNFQMHGIDLKDDSYFREFFNRYEDHFKTGIETVSEKIDAKPLLKG